MRRTTALALLFAAFTADATAGDVGQAVTRDEQVLDYVCTYAPIDAEVRRRVIDVAGLEDTAAAETSLVKMGEPARRVLASLVASRPTIEKRVAGVLERLGALHADVARRGLDHDVGWLAGAGAAGIERLGRILPKGAPREDTITWWTLHARSYRWDPTSDRYVPAGASSDSLRLRGHATIRLTDSAKLVGPESPFTLEVWWRCVDTAAQIYIAGDEAWPELSSDKVRLDTKCGWVLRRIPDGKGAAYLQFCAAVAPNDWFWISSTPLSVTSQWEHLALVSTGDAVRIYRDGECVAAGRCDDRKFLRSPTDLFVGPEETVRDDPQWVPRVAHHDLRGVRVTEGVRYRDDFTPPAALEPDGATVALLDFAHEATRLRDVSGRGHDGVSVGGRWISPLDLAEVRQLFKAFGATIGGLTLVEAESGATSPDWWIGERDEMSDGRLLEIWSDRETDALGHWAKVPFRVEKAGAYRVWFAGGSLDRAIGHTPDDYSPFSWRIDDAPAARVAGGVPTASGVRDNYGGLGALGLADLDAGEHVFDLRLLARRATDNHWSLWFDGIVLERVE